MAIGGWPGASDSTGGAAPSGQAVASPPGVMTPGAFVASGVIRAKSGAAGPDSATGRTRTPAVGWSGAFLVEDQRFLVRLLGQLEPHEQAGQDDQRDDD